MHTSLASQDLALSIGSRRIKRELAVVRLVLHLGSSAFLRTVSPGSAVSGPRRTVRNRRDDVDPCGPWSKDTETKEASASLLIELIRYVVLVLLRQLARLSGPFSCPCAYLGMYRACIRTLPWLAPSMAILAPAAARS